MNAEDDMSTTPSNLNRTAARPVQPAAQPTQQQVDATATYLNAASHALSSRQAQLEKETREVTEQRRVQDEKEAETKRDGIRAAAKQQQALNRQREIQPQIGDLVVVDLEKARPEQQTTTVRNAIKHLHNAGAHLSTGRVSDIEHSPGGRILTVQAPHATLQVPELLATRADLHEAAEAEPRDEAFERAHPGSFNRTIEQGNPT